MLCLVAAFVCVVSPAWGQIRVVTWNVAEFRGEAGDIQFVLELLDVDNHASPATDVAILVCQEVDQFSYDQLLTLLGPDWSSATYTNDNEDNYGGAQACFYRATLVEELPTGHDDLYTGAGRRADRWQFKLAGYADPVVSFYVYSMHLKAGNSSSSEVERETGALRILEDVAKLPSGTPAIIAGDMNFYDNQELGYVAFLDAGLIDPLGTGSWSGTSNSDKHTQSPRKVAAGGLASGGMDDRFDFQLLTGGMNTSGGLGVISSSYRAVGNDGNHYDEAINDGLNTYLSNQSTSTSLANALHEASDHLPVLADYRLPAVLDASLDSCDLGVVIEGWSADCVLDIANGAAAGHAGGAATLSWSVDGTGILDGTNADGTLAAGESDAIAVEIDTTVIGAFADSLLVTAEGPYTQHSDQDLLLEGQVLRHANPSFAFDADNNFYVYFVEFERDSGLHPLPVSFWNYNWDANQARMDVDGISTPELPLAFLGGSWSNVGPFPVSLPFEFDTTGLEPGSLARSVTIQVSDEDLPGAVDTQLFLTFNITITDPAVACPGDVNADGVVDIADLLALLAGFGTTDPVLDINQDNIVDVGDLLALLADFGCS